MKIKVVISKKTNDLLWARGDREKFWLDKTITLANDEVLLELDTDTIEKVIDLFDESTFDKALRRLIYTGPIDP